MQRRQRGIFPMAYQREAADRVARIGLSPGRDPAALGLHATLLRQWMMPFGTQGVRLARRSNTIS
jgi:hypothetical protein